jgi:inosine-uridine nucleoside N-ribohydrolase
VKIHLDTDLGGDIDDICALAMVLRWPGAEITGITTVLEDEGRRAGFVRRALELAGRSEVPVAAGADLRLGRFKLPADLPSEARYWPTPVTPAPGPLGAALDLLQRSIDQQAVVVGIGPFTNLALLEQREPGILQRTRLYLMGGKVHPAPAGYPDWPPEMDYNVQADPSAARQVLLCASRPTVVPIEITVQTALYRAQLGRLGVAGPLGALLARQAEAYAADRALWEPTGDRFPGRAADFINFQHDPLTCAIALGWDQVGVEPVRLGMNTDRDQLVLHPDGDGPQIRLVTRVDGNQFGATWLDVVCGSDST